MNLKAFLPLPPDPFPDLGGEHQKRSPLQISDQFRFLNPTFLKGLGGL